MGAGAHEPGDLDRQDAGIVCTALKSASMWMTPISAPEPHPQVAHCAQVERWAQKEAGAHLERAAVAGMGIDLDATAEIAVRHDADVTGHANRDLGPVPALHGTRLYKLRGALIHHAPPYRSRILVGACS